MTCEQPEAAPAGAPPAGAAPGVLPPAGPAPPVAFAAGPEAVGPLWPPAAVWAGDAPASAGPASVPPPAASPLPAAVSPPPPPVDVSAVRVTVVQLVVRAMRNSDSATTGTALARWRRPPLWL